MSVLDLTKKYRPKTLGDVFGQDAVVNYFKSVIKRRDIAPRYFLLSGGTGLGKTTVCRAFARDLLGSLQAPNYLELDSGDKRVQNDFEATKNLLFQEVAGDKVVVVDEIHILAQYAPSTIQQLLKIIEDYYHPRLFVFFATTDPQTLPDAFVGRLYHFHLESPSNAQVIAYLKDLASREGVSVSDAALGVAAVNANGHLRNAVRQLEQIIFQGEEQYLKAHHTLLNAIVTYFSDFTVDHDLAVKNMYGFPPLELRRYVMQFLRQAILSPTGRFHKAYPLSVQPKLLTQFLGLDWRVKEPDDFFSVLVAYRPILQGSKGT